MSYYRCKYCGTPASWSVTHCWRCSEHAHEAARRDGERMAGEVIRVFREALGLPAQREAKDKADV